MTAHGLRRAAAALALALGALVCGAGTARAQTAADEAAVRARLQAYASARATGDARAEAFCYTENGDFRSSGGAFVRGRAAIEEQLTVNAPDYRFDLTVETLRFLAPTVALVEAGVAAGPAGRQAALVGTYVLVRQGADWLIDAARIARAPAP